MTLADALGLSDARERLLVRVLQLGLAGLVGYGLLTGRPALALNGGVALAVTFVPALLRREYGYAMDAGLVLWITVAVTLHAVGFLGFYSGYRWYDEITHTISSTIVAGAGYALLRAFEYHSDDLDVPPEFRAVFVVVFVVAFGVVWEVFEFATATGTELLGVESPLIVFGVEDIVTDFVFNTVGAVVVALWGTGYADGFVRFLRRRLGPARGERQ